MYLGEQLPNPSDARLTLAAQLGVEHLAVEMGRDLDDASDTGRWDVGYTGMICPDHVPVSDVDPDKERQFAFCLGYIKALLQIVEAEM